jgi:zinc protease
VSTIDERIEDLKKAKADDVRQYYHDFFAPAEGEIVVIGQFNPEQVKKQLTEFFGDWKSNKPYARIPNSYAKVDAINHKVETPDKQNAVFLASSETKINDDDPDYPALIIGGTILGGGANSRLFQRIRVKDGLSYGAYADFDIHTKDDNGILNSSAIAAPQNMPKVEADFQEEIARFLKDGVTADELEKAKKAWLDERVLERGADGRLIDVINDLEHWGRTLQWNERLEAKVAALTPQQVSDALRRHIDPSAISIVKGGDFKKAGAYLQ